MNHPKIPSSAHVSQSVKIIAVDPGNSTSGVLLWRYGAVTGKLSGAHNPWISDVLHGDANCDDCPEFENIPHGHWILAVEMVACYGMPVGKETFETCLWIGRFLEAAERHGITTRLVYRKDIKMHLCGSMRAKDANIRQALIDKYGAPGTKKAPGKTYGVSGHLWSCLAIVDYVLANISELELD